MVRAFLAVVSLCRRRHELVVLVLGLGRELVVHRRELVARAPAVVGVGVGRASRNHGEWPAFDPFLCQPPNVCEASKRRLSHHLSAARLITPH